MTDFSRIKTRLLVDHPYFGTLASALEIVPNDNVESFRSEGNRFEYNETFFSELGEEETAFALCNASLHVILSHPARRGGRSPWLWRMACDHAINSLLLDNGFSPPPKITFEKRFDGLCAEEIYADLAEEFLRDEMNDRDVDENRRDEEHDEKLKQAQMEQLHQRALEKGSDMDALPEGIERLFVSVTGRIDWRRELRESIGGYYVSDYTLIPPSKKLLYEGIYLPGVHSRRLELAIAIDSSGSVDEELLSLFIAEIESIMELFGSYSIEVLVCDDRIRSHRVFENGEAVFYELLGGGGTDFTPVFEAIDQMAHPPKLLLYFTDLQGKFPPVEPAYEVLWIAPVHNGDVPFGRIIEMGDADD